MTDETTARDRAIEVDTTPRERAIPIIAAEMEECFPSMRGEGRMLAKAALNALAEQPEVLRALAGAPTADVASLVAKYRAKSAEFLEDWQDWDAHDGHERCGQGIAYSDVADELETLVAAAPEGVDAADEQERLREELGLEAGMRTAAVDELESLRRELWQLINADQLSDQDTLSQLRARDEAAKAVVRLWKGGDEGAKDALRRQPSRWPEFATALDALARAHEDAGTRAALQAATETLDSLPPASVSPGVGLMRASIEDHRDDLAEQLAHANETGGQDR